jgi:hypothetical protein
MADKRSRYYGGQDEIPKHLLADLHRAIAAYLARLHPGTRWSPRPRRDPSDKRRR